SSRRRTSTSRTSGSRMSRREIMVSRPSGGLLMISVGLWSISWNIALRTWVLPSFSTSRAMIEAAAASAHQNPSPMPMMPRMAAAEDIQSALFMVASAYRVLSCSSRDSGSFMRPRTIGGIMEYTRARPEAACACAWPAGRPPAAPGPADPRAGPSSSSGKNPCSGTSPALCCARSPARSTRGGSPCAAGLPGLRAADNPDVPSWLAGGSQRGQVVFRVLAGEQETLQRQEQGILAGRREDDMFTQCALMVAFVEIDKGLADLGAPGVGGGETTDQQVQFMSTQGLHQLLDPAMMPLDIQILTLGELAHQFTFQADRRRRV